jgi:uncharacterized protein (TIGR02145 family)
MKEVGNFHWSSENSDATNESGFTALPGSYRDAFGSFLPIGEYGYWWDSTVSPDDGVTLYMMTSFDTGCDVTNVVSKADGASVRCIEN